MSAIPSRASAGARPGTASAIATPTASASTIPKTLARIRALAIPPAWTDVWISPDANGHIQATGRDVRGRKQYRYHERWSACRDEAKYSSLVAFAEALPRLRERIERDLRRRDLSRDRVIASVIWLLDNTMIRVGNATYARDNKSFGLTTLRQRHVAVEGSRVRFAFKGKSGKQWKLDLVDRRIVRIVRQVQELPGQQLFQYLDDERRAAIGQLAGRQRLSARGDGRRFHLEAFPHLGRHRRPRRPVCRHRRARRRDARPRSTLNGLIDEVAQRLGNTRAVCRKCYIHPAVIEGLDERHAGSRDGSGAQELPQAGRRSG